MAVAWSNSGPSLAGYTGRPPALCPFPGTSGACPLAAHLSPRVISPGPGDRVNSPIAADLESPSPSRSRARFGRRVSDPRSMSICTARFSMRRSPMRQFHAGIPISQEIDDLGDLLSATAPEPRDVGFVLTEPLHRPTIALVEHYKQRIGHAFSVPRAPWLSWGSPSAGRLPPRSVVLAVVVTPCRRALTQRAASHDPSAQNDTP
jgi:hypothetical protein